MRRRQIWLAREELRRTLNTEQAETPVLPEEVEEETPRPKRGRPRKVVKDDDIP